MTGSAVGTAIVAPDRQGLEFFFTARFFVIVTVTPVTDHLRVFEIATDKTRIGKIGFIEATHIDRVVGHQTVDMAVMRTEA